MKIYQIGDDNYFTGEIREIGASESSPKHWTRLAPPALAGAQVARWENAWVVLPAMPPQPPIDLSLLKSELIAQTKIEAQKRIFTKFPQHKQANMQARSQELSMIEAGQFRDSAGVKLAARVLTAAEVNDLAAIGEAWAWVKSVRIASDLIEADINATAGPVNFNVSTNAKWPV